MKKIVFAALAAVFCLVPPACSKCSGDSETAKKQAFEAKSKSETVRRDFDPKAFGTDPGVRDRMFSMHWIEATHRLGGVSFRQSYRYEFHGPEKEVTLSGLDEIDQLKNGDFVLKSENDSGYGAEAILVGGKYYVKNRGGGFHEHQNDRGDAGSKKQEAFAAAKSFWELFEGRLAVADGGIADHSGRPAHKYTLSFDPSIKPRVTGKPEPASATDGGTGPLSQGKMEPRSASGVVLVDEKARTIVRTDIKGTLVTGRDGAVRVTVEFKNELGLLKPDFVVKAPEVAQEPKRPKIGKDPLGKIEGKKGESEKSGAKDGAGKKDGDDNSEGGQ